MTIHFILVDFENVQPSHLGSLTPAETHVRIFAGASQTKVDLGLAQALQRFGTHAEYIRVVGSGKNALDFHIAFYIGELATKHPSAKFTIVSKDTGFDPLIKHLVERGFQCKRVASLPGGTSEKDLQAKPPTKKAVARAPSSAKPSESGTKDSRLQEVRERLVGLKAARPRTVKTLSSSLRSWFKPPLSSDALAGLLTDLRTDGVIVVDGTKVSYSL